MDLGEVRAVDLAVAFAVVGDEEMTVGGNGGDGQEVGEVRRVGRLFGGGFEHRLHHLRTEFAEAGVGAQLFGPLFGCFAGRSPPEQKRKVAIAGATGNVPRESLLHVFVVVGHWTFPQTLSVRTVKIKFASNW